MTPDRRGRGLRRAEDRDRSDSRAGRARRLVFALVPTGLVLVLVGGAEAGLRLAGLERPALRPPPLPAELAGIHRADDELFWTMVPNFDGEFQGVRVVTNSLGLRS